MEGRNQSVQKSTRIQDSRNRLAKAACRPCKSFVKIALTIQYHFLPVHNVAVKRLVGYARHLPASGWRILALTRDWQGLNEADASWGLSWEPHLEKGSGCFIHRIPSPPIVRGRATVGEPSISSHTSGARRLAAKVAAKAARLSTLAFGNYPDEFVGWVRAAVAAGEQVARTHSIDVILSYCPPESNHLVAHHLARRLGVPWVPFFGDLYGFLDPPLPTFSVERLARIAWHRWCLAPASACIGVSPAMVAFLGSRYGKPSYLVHTGFDADDFAGPDPKDAINRQHMLVSHVGSVYPGDQRPEVLFDGIDRLLARHPEVEGRLEVRFVGSKCDDHLRKMLAGRAASRVCTVHPKVDSATAQGIVASSDGVLAFNCTAHRDRYGTLSYPTKVFEAFGARRPVMAVPADGDWVEVLLQQTRGGVSARDAEEVAACLHAWFRSWEREGRVAYNADEAAIAGFTRKRQTERLVDILDSVGRS